MNVPTHHTRGRLRHGRLDLTGRFDPMGRLTETTGGL